MVVGGGDGRRRRRRARALPAAAALDPADLEAEALRRADVVVLALRDVEEVRERIAMDALAPAAVREDLRVGLVGPDTSAVMRSSNGSPSVRLMCSSAQLSAFVSATSR